MTLDALGRWLLDMNWLYWVLPAAFPAPPPPKKADLIFTLHLFTDVPKLPPLPRPGEENEEDDDDEDSKEDKPKKQRKLSGPKAIDPYANDESSMLIPIAVAIAVFLPTLFCLCKLWQPTAGWFYLFLCKLHIKNAVSESFKAAKTKGSRSPTRVLNDKM